MKKILLLTLLAFTAGIFGFSPVNAADAPDIKAIKDRKVLKVGWTFRVPAGERIRHTATVERNSTPADRGSPGTRGPTFAEPAHRRPSG